MQLSLEMPPSIDERPAEPPLILIPCSAGSARNWNPLIERLTGFDACPLNLFGHGARFQPPTRLPLAEEAVLLLDQIPAKKRFHLVGHSYGGAVALKIARGWPERLLSLTLIEPSCFHVLTWPLEGAPAPVDEIRHLALVVEHHLAAGNPAGAMATFIDFWSGAPTWASLSIARQLQLTELAGHIPNQFRALFDEPASLRDYAGIEVPTLVLCGNLSPRASRQISRLLTEAMPHARHRTIRNAGHMSPLTHPADAAAHVAEHLARCGGGRSLSPNYQPAKKQEKMK